MVTWSELCLRACDLEDHDAQLIWRLLNVAISHPSYNHLTLEKIFNVQKDRILKKV